MPDGVDAPDPEAIDLGVPEASITTAVDVAAALDRKRAAMAAHPSQIPADSFFLSIDDEAFRRASASSGSSASTTTPPSPRRWILL